MTLNVALAYTPLSHPSCANGPARLIHPVETSEEARLMKIALIGASGRVGSRLLAEMLRRGHEVTGIARDTSNVPPQAHLTLRSADANQPSGIAPILHGHGVAAGFAPGERTGKFRLGRDQLLVGADGKSRISMEDYAIAFVDELESPRHARARFTAGY